MMTRHRASSAVAAVEPLAHLQPVRQLPRLTDEVVDRIGREIQGGRLPPGSRLPTEMSLMKTLGVSRTVVREAVAALKSEGLVVTRQGSGAFVATDTRRVPFRIVISDRDAFAEAISTMELRLAVEVEAAAIAAERATSGGLRAIRKAHQVFLAAIELDGSATPEDFAFHHAIARATQNPRFADFVDFLGRHLIPRQVVRGSLRTIEARRTYLLKIAREHEKILASMEARRPVDARNAMRIHLANGLDRYRKLASSK